MRGICAKVSYCWVRNGLVAPTGGLTARGRLFHKTQFLERFLRTEGAPHLRCKGECGVRNAHGVALTCTRTSIVASILSWSNRAKCIVMYSSYVRTT